VAVLLFSATYVTDAAGLRTGITEADGAGTTRTVAYDYDQTRRLTREIIDHRDATRDRTTAWTYDRVGNRLTQVTTTGAGATQATTTVTSTYDANDRLTREDERTGSAAPRITTTTYDANGNTTRRDGPDGVTEYAWDDANRLKEQRTASGRTEYRYDADGLRIGQTTYPTTGSPTRTDYVVDPTYAYANVIERWEGEGAAGSGGGAGAGGGATGAPMKLAAVHVFGEGIVGQTTCTPTVTSAATDCPNATERALHADGFGSTRYLTNAAGTITDRIDYDAFGTEIHREGDTDVEHLYRGEQYDANLGYYYLRARYYAPAKGRFTTMDTFPALNGDPATLHRYVFVGNEPIGRIDPSGLIFTSAFGYAVEERVEQAYESINPFDVVDYGRWWFGLKPDIQNHTKLRFMEIKPLSPSGIAKGVAQIKEYVQQYGPRGYLPGMWNPESPMVVEGRQVWFKNLLGVILYTDEQALAHDLATVSSFEDARRVSYRAGDVQTQVSIDAQGIATRNFAIAAITGAAAVGSLRLVAQVQTATIIRM
jgi:RHS repeat-associated protein